MCVLVSVEDIGDAHLAYRNDNAIAAASALELVCGLLNGLRRTFEVVAFGAQTGAATAGTAALANLVSLAAGKPCHSHRVVQSEALIDSGLIQSSAPDQRRAPR